MNMWFVDQKIFIRLALVLAVSQSIGCPDQNAPNYGKQAEAEKQNGKEYKKKLGTPQTNKKNENGDVSGLTSYTNAGAPTTPSDEMKLYSYPKLGFQISFPSSWVVRDKSGDLVGDHQVEGRRSADIPSILDDNKQPAMSKAEQQLTDIAFLKGIRVTILVRHSEQIFVERSLLDSVNNRIRGIKMLGKVSGDDVDIKQLERIQLATVPAYVTKFTKRYNKEGFAGISTTTAYYDFERDGRSYTIALDAPADKFDEYKAEFTRTIRSFTFIEGR